MLTVNFLAVVVAAVAAFVVSFVWYIVFGEQLSSARGVGAAAMTTPPAWMMVVELVRSLVVASVVAGLATRLGIADWTGASLLGLTAWIGFPAVLLVGSVLWENVPGTLAAIHAGDWLVKLLVIAIIVSIWR